MGAIFPTVASIAGSPTSFCRTGTAAPVPTRSVEQNMAFARFQQLVQGKVGWLCFSHFYFYFLRECFVFSFTLSNLHSLFFVCIPGLHRMTDRRTDRRKAVK